MIEGDRTNHELTCRETRRIAVRAARLDSPRPTELREALDAVGTIRLDLTPYLCPSSELVLWSRLGRRFDPAELDSLRTHRLLVKIAGNLQRAERYALHRAQMEAWPGEPAAPFAAQQARWVEANRAAAEEILQTLRSEGPLPPKELDVLPSGYSRR